MNSLKDALAALVALTLAAVSAAADCLAAGAIRPDHEQRFGALRVTLDQLAEAAAACEALAASGQPEDPDAEAFAKLRADLAEARQALTSGGDLAALRADILGHIETLTLTVDALSDNVAALVPAKG
jgi:hypothetical protein